MLLSTVVRTFRLNCSTAPFLMLVLLPSLNNFVKYACNPALQILSQRHCHMFDLSRLKTPAHMHTQHLPLCLRLCMWVWIWRNCRSFEKPRPTRPYVERERETHRSVIDPPHEFSSFCFCTFWCCTSGWRGQMMPDKNTSAVAVYHAMASFSGTSCAGLVQMQTLLLCPPVNYVDVMSVLVTSGVNIHLGIPNMLKLSSQTTFK